MSELYTSSRLRVLRECLRKHHYRYGLGLTTEPTDSMRFGTVGHRALEAYYRVWQKAPTADEASADGMCFADRRHYMAARLPAALAEIDTSDLSVWDRIKLHLLVVAYDARWGAEDWEVVAVEVEFRYMLGEHLIGGKIDAIIRDRRDGRVYVVEHKTAGADVSLGSSYWERLTIDSQVSIYIDGAAVLGYDVSGCVYDVLKRPSHEIKLATPVESREYTKGKGCKGCGGSAKPGAVAVGSGCDACAGTGWKEPPRLHANQRDTDESIEEFEARLTDAIAEDPNAYLLRGVTVRLDDELPALRQDLLDAISVASIGVTPRNPDACARYGRMCDYFGLCSGRSAIADFQRGRIHPELA